MLPWASIEIAGYGWILKSFLFCRVLFLWSPQASGQLEAINVLLTFRIEMNPVLTAKLVAIQLNCQGHRSGKLTLAEPPHLVIEILNCASSQAKWSVQVRLHEHFSMCSLAIVVVYFYFQCKKQVANSIQVTVVTGRVGVEGVQLKWVCRLLSLGDSMLWNLSGWGQ